MPVEGPTTGNSPVDTLNPTVAFVKGEAPTARYAEAEGPAEIEAPPSIWIPSDFFRTRVTSTSAAGHCDMISFLYHSNG
jgi:hypothetical protein